MMSENRLPVDDPRLTAYALGELDPAGRAEVEGLLKDSLECREAVAEIRELAGLLSDGLKAEPAPVLTEAQRVAVVLAASDTNQFVATAVGNPTEPAKRQAGATGGQWARRFASVAMIAAMLMVALLVVPSGRLRDLSRPQADESRDDRQSLPELADLLKRDSSLESELARIKGPVAAAVADQRVGDLAQGVDVDNPKTVLGGFQRAPITRHVDIPAISTDLRRRENKAEPLSRLADGVDEAAATYTNEVKYPNEKKRQELSERRAKPQRPSVVESAKPAAAEGSESNVRSGRERLAGIRARKSNVLKEKLNESAIAKPASGPTPQTVRASGRTDAAVAGKPESSVDQDDDTPASDGPADAAKRVVDLGRLPEQTLRQNQAFFDRFGVTNGVSDFYLSSAPKDGVAQKHERRDANGNGITLERLYFGEGVARAKLLAENSGRELRELESLQPRFWGYLVHDQNKDNAEVYEPIVENAFVTPLAEPLSTFSVDVDTASYANVRRFLTNRQMPPRNAVRIEELINYFRYDDPQPVDGRPFSVNVEVGNAPWRPQHRLVRIGLKGREIPRDKRPTSNLVFLVDVSGSMSSENKLPLVKAGLSLLAEQMTESDRVAIVTYSDTATLRLESTTGDNRKPILDTIAALQANGSTNGAGGIQLAYETAVRHFVEGGTNRVILCTDGDFNVGVSDDEQLVQLIQERARTKVFFSVFGFGMGNLKDGKLEKLADKGNGHYAYIDGQREAKKVFVDELAGTLVTIAKDVKLQVEFNPARVEAYRLIGYENRALAAQDFHNDKKDAGEIGAGHSVTALYEIAPAGNDSPKPAGEGLRYQRVGVAKEGGLDAELLTVKLRFKQPEADTSELFEVPAVDPSRLPNDAGSPTPSRSFQWAAAVAAFGMVLRDSQYRGQAGLDLVLELAQGAKGDDQGGLRQEFIDLVQTVKSMRPELALSPSDADKIAAKKAEVAAAETKARQRIREEYLWKHGPKTAELAERRATVGGKYKSLLRIILAPADEEQYGPFHDYGRWEGTSYLGHENLPQGYWVYVAPDWYIWGDAMKSEDRK